MNGFDVNENYYRPVYAMKFGAPSTSKLQIYQICILIIKFKERFLSKGSGLSPNYLESAAAAEAESDVAFAAAPASFKMANFESSGSKQQIKVRKDFPETWLFENLKADEKEGTAVFSKNIPDTITSWVVSAFAVDKKTGLVLSENPAKVILIYFEF